MNALSDWNNLKNIAFIVVAPGNIELFSLELSRILSGVMEGLATALGFDFGCSCAEKEALRVDYILIGIGYGADIYINLECGLAVFWTF